MSHEDADVVKIRSFVTKCLESVGTLVEFIGYNYAEVIIPDEFTYHFDGENYYKLAFDFDVAKQHEDAEFVTYGSYFLDKVIDLASQRGLTCKRHIIDEDLEIRNLPQKIASKLIFKNQRMMTFVANSPVLYHYLLFNFKVSYVSDEREDQIIKLLVNLNTGIVDNRMLESIGSAFFTDNPHTNYGVEDMQSIDCAYKAATEDLERQIQPRIQELQNKIDIRLAGEKSRINEYYDQIDNELKSKLEKLSEKENKVTNTIDDKLRLSMIERQRRLKEIEEKNALNAYVTLFNATLISQTKIRNKYSWKKGKVERDIYLVWNPVLKDVEPLICEVCGTETFDVDLCPNSHLGCVECVSSCNTCGTRICKSCGTFSECHVCSEFLCDKCKYMCENCGDVLCNEHIESCTCKTEERRKKQEIDTKKREEHILEFQKIPLSLKKPVKQYLEEYVRRNIDSLDEDWKKSLTKLHSILVQHVLTAEEKIKTREIFSDLDEKYPDNAWVKARLVLTYERFSNRLLTLSHQAVSLAPQLALSHTAYAYMLQKSGEEGFDKAISEYEKAIKLAGDDEPSLKANAHYQIAMFQREYIGDWREAKRRLEIAVEIDPSFQLAHQALNSLKATMRARYRF